MTPTGTDFLKRVLKWLREGVGFDEWAKAHAKTLAEQIESDAFGKGAARTDGWSLAPLLTMAPGDASEQLCLWLWRNEHAGPYCSPTWTRNFSNAAGLALFRSTDEILCPPNMDFAEGRESHMATRKRYEERMRHLESERIAKVPAGDAHTHEVQADTTVAPGIMIETYDDGTARIEVGGKVTRGGPAIIGLVVAVERRACIADIEKLARVLLHHVEVARKHDRENAPQVIAAERLDL